MGGVLKPSVVFFGENVPNEVKHEAKECCDDSTAFLVLGTTLQTPSVFRLVKKAREDGKKIAIVNLGDTRDNQLADYFIEDRTEDFLSQLLYHHSLMDYLLFIYSGMRRGN